MNENKTLKELSTEIDLFDDMLTSLVELLEEKGILTQEEWENKIQIKMSRKRSSTDYREIQFRGGNCL